MRRLIVPLLLALAGCAGSTPLLTPSSFGGELETVGVLTGTAARGPHSLRIALAIDGARLRVQGVDPVGLPAFKLEQDAAGRVIAQRGSAAQGIPARDWLAALQLALWPTRALQSAHAGGAYRVTVEAGRRELWNGSRLLLRAESQRTDDGVELRLEFVRSGQVQQLQLERTSP